MQERVQDQDQVWELQERDFAQMIETNPNDLEGYILRAHWFWLASHESQALSDLDHILELDPDNVFALTYRGSSRMVLDIDGAQEDWQRAFELAPNNPEVYEVVGPTYRWVGNLEQSLR